MAWGLFNKIKKGFIKTGAAFKKAAGWVNDKIVKPFKPYIKAAVNTFIPGGGNIVEAVSDGLEAVSDGNYRDAGKSVKEIINFASDKYRQKKS